MKQFITQRQFQVLTSIQQEIVEQWTIARGYAIEGDLYGYQFEPHDDGKIWTAYPRLSIGQLIEFLVEKKRDVLR